MNQEPKRLSAEELAEIAAREFKPNLEGIEAIGYAALLKTDEPDSLRVDRGTLSDLCRLATQQGYIPDLLGHIAAQEAIIAAMRPVVEAAAAWSEAPNGEDVSEHNALIFAVSAYLNALEKAKEVGK